MNIGQQFQFDFAIDRGGTFTDIYCVITDQNKKIQNEINCQETVVLKLLSENKNSYNDAPTEGIRRILNSKSTNQITKNQKIPTNQINTIRMGTTVATNALLERRGDKVALLITKGLKDTLKIGNQSRPQIFDLSIKRAQPIYERVIEIDERVRPYHASEKGDNLRIFEAHGQKFVLEKDINCEDIQRQLKDLKQNTDITSLSVVLMHSYAFQNHEQAIRDIAKQIGFDQVSLSSEIMKRVKFVKRGQTCCVDAYLNPHIFRYLQGFIDGFQDTLLDTTRVFFMQSDGSLVPINKFTGSKAILSGPAGGVVGYSITSSLSQENQTSKMPVIGLDMGGTSTDVSRYDNDFDHVFETEIAGISIQAPQLNINTVAAGGGSRLVFSKGLFKVGPESCGADPGPVCYRKPGGMLAITDANLILGKLLPEYFPNIFGEDENLPLDYDAALNAFNNITNEINQQIQGPKLSIHEVALGFIRVSNEAMARPIRSLTQAKGYNPKNHALSIFGGAGAQHACSISKILGIKKIFIHKYCGILSAYGLGLADVVKEQEVPYSVEINDIDNESIAQKIEEQYQYLQKYNTQELQEYGLLQQQISHQKYLNLRYKGTDTSIMIQQQQQQLLQQQQQQQQQIQQQQQQQNLYDLNGYKEDFKKQHQREFGFNFDQRPIIVDNIRVRSVGGIGKLIQQKIETAQENEQPQFIKQTQVWFDVDGRAKSLQTYVYDLISLKSGMRINGPSIILNSTSTILIEPEWVACVDDYGNIEINYTGQQCEVDNRVYQSIKDVPLDPIELSIFSHRFMSIAEQMGVCLQRTAASVNIKERLDFSCALFDNEGNLVANAPHVPVHLGSMQDAVRYQIKALGDTFGQGDVILSNHPLAGGTHLPDLTIITPVFRNNKPIFYVASRGHHADIGGIQPGSMPSFSKKLEEEGAAFISFKIVENNQFQEERVSEILCNQIGENPLIRGTRNLSDNLGDFKAQIAANQRGISLLQDLIDEYSIVYVLAYMRYIQQNAEMCVRDMLSEIVNRIEPDQSSESIMIEADEYMDDGSRIRLQLTINRKHRNACFDFTGTDPEMYGNCNAPRSITSSAIIYCLRCLVNTEIPLNQGCLNPIQIILPQNCFLNPSISAAVVGGNVLTSQRLTDVVLKAFHVCAASQGCMNNLTFGDKTFGYYETIAGGHGAGMDWHGQDGVHTHMTNTRITDPEIMEQRYPVVLRQFLIREGSGGKGQYNGGNGIIREIEFLKDDIDVSILSDRRVTHPYGLKGGQNGACGQNLIIYPDGKIQNFGGKNSIRVQAHTRIKILTPGGGGYGKV